MHDYCKLSDLARYEIEDLQAAGINPTPDEIVELSAIGWQVETPETRQYLSKGKSVKCGNIVLWSMTLQSGDWYRRIGCNLEGYETAALGYAMATCYDTGAEFPEDKKDAERLVSAWVKSVKATIEELTISIGMVLSQTEDFDMPPDPEDEKSKGMTAGELSVQLVAMCGGEPDFWEKRCSNDYAIDLLNAVIRQRNESGKPLPNDPRIKATQALGWAVEKIKRRHEQELEQNG